MELMSEATFRWPILTRAAIQSVRTNEGNAESSDGKCLCDISQVSIVKGPGVTRDMRVTELGLPRSRYAPVHSYQRGAARDLLGTRLCAGEYTCQPLGLHYDTSG